MTILKHLRLVTYIYRSIKTDLLFKDFIRFQNNQRQRSKIDLFI